MLELAARPDNALAARFYAGGALLNLRSPAMPDAETRTPALFADLRPTTKPWAFEDLPALARRIHRDRRGGILQLRPVVVRFRDAPRAMVEVLAQSPGSGRCWRIGHAWIGGRPWEALQAALDRAEPSAGVYEPGA
jgi:hypothetical protein